MFGINAAEIFEAVVGAIVIFVLVLIAGVWVKLFLQWRANEAAPVVRVEAMVVASRKWVSRRRWSGVEPVYRVTFEDPSGERLELPVRGQAVVEGLTEGVQGLLTYQGTRFQGFVRHDAVDGQR